MSSMLICFSLLLQTATCTSFSFNPLNYKLPALNSSALDFESIDWPLVNGRLFKLLQADLLSKQEKCSPLKAQYVEMLPKSAIKELTIECFRTMDQSGINRNNVKWIQDSAINEIFPILSAEAQLGLSAHQLSLIDCSFLSDSFLNSISPKKLKAISAKCINRLNIMHLHKDRIPYLDKDALSILNDIPIELIPFVTAEQINGIDCHALSAEYVMKLKDDTVKGMKNECLLQMPLASFEVISEKVLKFQMDPQVMNRLDNYTLSPHLLDYEYEGRHVCSCLKKELLKSITEEKLKYLSSRCIVNAGFVGWIKDFSVFSDKAFSDFDSLDSLDNDQLESITAAQWYNMKPFKIVQVHFLTNSCPNFVNGISSELYSILSQEEQSRVESQFKQNNLNDKDFSLLTKERIGWLTDCSKISLKQFKLIPKETLKYLKSSCLNEIDGKVFENLTSQDIRSLSDEIFESLGSKFELIPLTLIDQMRPQQFHHFGEKINNRKMHPCRFLTAKHVQLIPIKTIEMMNVKCIRALSRAVFRWLPPISSPTFWSVVTSKQLMKMHASSLSNMDTSVLGDELIMTMKTENTMEGKREPIYKEEVHPCYGGLSVEQISQMNRRVYENFKEKCKSVRSNSSMLKVEWLLFILILLK